MDERDHAHSVDVDELVAEVRETTTLLRAPTAGCDADGTQHRYGTAGWREIAERSLPDYMALEQEHDAG